MSGQVSFTDRYLHILRNPYGWSEDQVRDARLWAADNIERLETRIDALRGLLREARKALVEELVECCCHEAYTSRSLIDPNCRHHEQDRQRIAVDRTDAALKEQP
jgi:hypothetical protein